MPIFEFKTINAFYEDDIARYLIAEKITKKENINIHNLLKSILINRDIDFNKIDINDKQRWIYIIKIIAIYFIKFLQLIDKDGQSIYSLEPKFF